jgi:hypothetical protein
MQDSPGRKRYRVEHVVRAPTPTEAALLEERERAWRAEVDHRARCLPAELVGALAMGLAALALGLAERHAPLVLFGMVATVVLSFALWLLRWRARDEAEGPWDPPEGGWQIRETIVHARSVTGAISGTAGHERWLLFELADGEWFCLAPSALPGAHDARSLAFAELRLAAAWPGGPYLAVHTHGPRLPARGAVGERPRDPSQELELGLEWHPADGELAAEVAGRVSSDSVPPWVRDSVAPRDAA